MSLVGTCDLSSDFWSESRNGTMRLPLWIWCFFPPEANLQEVQQVLKTAENAKVSFHLRKFDISMVAGHEGFFGCPREEFVQKVRHMGMDFYSEGRYANNSNLLSHSFGDELLDYLNLTFSIKRGLSRLKNMGLKARCKWSKNYFQATRGWKKLLISLSPKNLLPKPLLSNLNI